MKVMVDQARCIKNAICTGIAPEVFEIGDDGELLVLQERPSEDLRDQVEEAVRSCPMGAIEIEED